MTKKEFISLTGEEPIDVLGGDWRNDMAEWDEEDEKELPDDDEDAGDDEPLDGDEDGSKY